MSAAAGAKPQVALVTGSARGIGRAVAERLCADGFAVIGVDVLEHEDADPLTRVIAEDLGSAEGCQRVLAAAASVNVLVNNAAMFSRTPFEEATVEELDRLYAVNLRAPALLARGLAPAMARSGWGRIVNISSVGAHTGGLTPASAFYSATKAGLHALTRYLAREYGPSGVTANAVAPGWIDTPMSSMARDAGAAATEGSIALARTGTPAEVAAVVGFLAGNDSSYLTGAILDVNGGWLMR